LSGIAILISYYFFLANSLKKSSASEISFTFFVLEEPFFTSSISFSSFSAFVFNLSLFLETDLVADLICFFFFFISLIFCLSLLFSSFLS